jgi:hypothetical protein
VSTRDIPYDRAPIGHRLPRVSYGRMTAETRRQIRDDRDHRRCLCPRLVPDRTLDRRRVRMHR